MLKIGDRVRSVETFYLKDDEVGRTGMIVDVTSDSLWAYEVLYDEPRHHELLTGAYEECELELIECTQ